jgi:hypothetical protein
VYGSEKGEILLKKCSAKSSTKKSAKNSIKSST